MAVDAAVVRGNEVREALADDAAFRVWYERTLPRVFAYLLARTRDSDLAEELTQQTYFAAIDARHAFDGRADSVTWLCAIARHKLADHFRRLERDERRTGRMVVRELMGAEPDRWAAVDVRDAIAAALATLPSSQRAVLVFADLDELPIKDVARLIGKSTGATQSLLARARSGFRAAYRGEVRDG